jgi:cytochrome c oxidase assembly factor CtaG
MKTVLSYWTFDYLPLITVTALCTLYGVNAKFTAKSLFCFLTALCFIILCFFSPLNTLSAHYLLSAHMAVHVILLLCVGPLLLLSLPDSDEHFLRFFGFLKRYPFLSWFTGVAIMWIWHFPMLFNTLMPTTHYPGMGAVHAFEAVSLVVAGIVFAAPVIHPNNKFRIGGLTGVMYLFTACLACSVLGLLMTFAPADTYHHFLSPSDECGFNQIITGQWGLTQLKDQQAAGLIMWVPCCLIYVSGAMYLLMNWFEGKEASNRAEIELNKI